MGASSSGCQGVLSTLAGCWDHGSGQSQLLDDAEGSGSQGQSRPDAEPAPHLCQEQRRDLLRGLCSWGLSWGDHLLSPHGDLGKVAIQVSLVPVSLPLPLPHVVRSPGALRPGLRGASAAGSMWTWVGPRLPVRGAARRPSCGSVLQLSERAAAAGGPAAVCRVVGWALGTQWHQQTRSPGWALSSAEQVPRPVGAVAEARAACGGA